MGECPLSLASAFDYHLVGAERSVAWPSRPGTALAIMSQRLVSLLMLPATFNWLGVLTTWLAEAYILIIFPSSDTREARQEQGPSTRTPPARPPKKKRPGTDERRPTIVRRDGRH